MGPGAFLVGGVSGMFTGSAAGAGAGAGDGDAGGGGGGGSDATAAGAAAAADAAGGGGGGGLVGLVGSGIRLGVVKVDSRVDEIWIHLSPTFCSAKIGNRYLMPGMTLNA